MAAGLLNRLHKAIDQLYNQGQSRYFPPDKKDDAINNVTIELFEELVDEYQRTQRLSDYLLPFQDFKDINVVGGFADLPENYAHATDISGLIPTSSGSGASVVGSGVQNKKAATDIEYKPIVTDIVKDGEWTERLGDPIAPPSIEFPIARFTRNKIQVEPKTLKRVRVHYLKLPKTAIWGFGISTDGSSYIYDNSTTTETDWPTTAFKEVLKRTISYLGIPMKDNIGIGYKQM